MKIQTGENQIPASDCGAEQSEVSCAPLTIALVHRIRDTLLLDFPVFILDKYCSNIY